ncbi:MAG: PorP/SprF family type IX secretion system membrane protein [Bacteroidota bacterium]
MRFICLFLLLPVVVLGQDPHFTQPLSAPLQLNPALAGSWTAGRITNSNRLQWNKLYGNYTSYNVNYDQYLHPLRGGLGINYLHDNAGQGTLLLNRFDLTYSGRIPMLKNDTGYARLIIQPALSFGYAVKTLNWDKLTFGDMIDPRRGFVFTSQETTGKSRVIYPDLSAGLVIYSERVLGGIAVHHLAEPNEGFAGNSPLPRKYVMHLSGILGSLSDSARHLNLFPSLVMMSQMDHRNYIFSVHAKYHKYSLGVGYRVGDALLFSAGFAHQLFKVSYSYDLTVSGLAGYTGGAHELSLVVRLFDEKWKHRLNLRRYNF